MSRRRFGNTFAWNRREKSRCFDLKQVLALSCRHAQKPMKNLAADDYAGYDAICPGCRAKAGGNLRIFPHQIADGICVQQINHCELRSKSTPFPGGNFESAMARSNSATSSLDTCGSESAAAKTADGVPGAPTLSCVARPTRISTDSPIGRSTGSSGTRTRPSKWTRNFVVMRSLYQRNRFPAIRLRNSRPRLRGGSASRGAGSPR